MYRMLVLLISGISLAAVASSQGGAPAEAKIVVNTVEGKMHVSALLFNPQSERLEYWLELQKSGVAGNSKLTQSGYIDLAEGKRSRLDGMQISWNAEDQYSIALKLMRDGVLLAEDGVVLGE